MTFAHFWMRWRIVTMLTLPDLWSLLTSPGAQIVGWSLLHFLWQGTLVALALAGGLRLLRNHPPRFRYGAACAALLGLLALPVATALLLHSGDLASTVGGVPSGVGEPEAKTSSSVVGTSWVASQLRSIVPWIVLGWIGGVLISAGRVVTGMYQTQRLRRSGSAAPTHWQDRLTTLARQIGLDWAVALRESSRVSVPTVVGWWRPILLVPAGFLSGLPPAQVEAVLLHELAHIRRHDVLVARLQAVCETLLFFHPATWWISRRVRRSREACCDQVVVNTDTTRTDYARALLGLAEQVRTRTQPAAQLGAKDGRLLHRVRRILNPTPPPSPGRRWLARAVALLLLLGGAAGLVHLASQQDLSAASSLVAGSAAEAEASFVLRTDSTGRVGLYPSAPSDVHRSLNDPQAIRFGTGEAPLESEHLRRSVRANVDLDHMNRHLQGRLDAERLRHILQVQPDSLSRMADGTIDPDRLMQAVQREVSDSLGRTLRRHMDMKDLDRPVKIRVALNEPGTQTTQPNDSKSRADATEPSLAKDLFAREEPHAPKADSVLSQAVTQSLRDTTIILGRNTTVIRSGEHEVVLHADRRSS